MSTINRFQVYSQRENTITNNVLFMFSELYRINPIYFEEYVNGLLEEEVYRSQPEFAQQKNNQSDGIIDGMVAIPSSKIIIETKPGGLEKIQKLLKYTASFKGTSIKVLLHLSSDEYSQNEQQSIRKSLAELDEGITIHFGSITYQDLVDQLQACRDQHPHDSAVNLLSYDFESYCNQMNLLRSIDFVLRAMACGQSYDINVKHGFYFDYADRGFSQFNYLGIYKDKAVRHIGKVEVSVVAHYDKKKGLVLKQDESPITSQQTNRLYQAMKEAYELGWDVDRDHRLFLLQDLTATNFKKITPGGIFRVRYFDLKEILEKKQLNNVHQIAEGLKTKSWN